MNLGAFDYLHKPVDIELLSETLEKSQRKDPAKKRGAEDLGTA